MSTTTSSTTKNRTTGFSRQGLGRSLTPSTDGPRAFILTAITSDPQIAQSADRAGVDRVGIDLERRGKLRRQGHIAGARISDHRFADLKRIAPLLRQASAFVRLNPPYAGTGGEVERALQAGARVVMLPHFRTPQEVAAFAEAVAGRATAVLLLETRSAIERLPDIVRVSGIAEIAVGLNDLRLSLGLTSIFEAVVSDEMLSIAESVRGAGLRFGFGGLARFDDDSLPVPPDLVYAQYPRLRAESAWLARSFFAGIEPNSIGDAVEALRRRMAYWYGCPEAELEEMRDRLAARIRQDESA